MTILSQAEAIRDATVPNSLTPDIVGDCLVDIANALVTNSASYIAQSGTTTIPSGTAVPVVGVTVPANAIITGSGLSVEMDGGNDYAIFKGLSDTHAYSITYCLSINGSEAADVQFDLLDDALAIISTGSLVQTIAATVDRYACTFSATFTGQTEVTLGIGRVGSTSTIDIGTDGISARIVDLGLAV